METQLDRLKSSIDYLIDNKRVGSPADLARALNKQKSYMSEVLAGKRDISEQFVRVFTNQYPEISFEWIKTGSGDMTILPGIYGRINTILAKEGLSKRDFEKGSGSFCFIAPGIYNNAEDNPGDIRVAAGWIECLNRLFPQYSTNWLLRGEGPMIEPSNTDSIEAPLQERNVHSLIRTENRIPLLPYDAIAGYGSFDFQDLPIEDYYSIGDFKGADFLIRVKGDSMSPKFNGGDIVACKKIEEITFWQWHKVYAICTKNQGILIKRIEEYRQNPAFITCRSENPAYSPFELHEDEIISVALVLGAVILE